MNSLPAHLSENALGRIVTEWANVIGVPPQDVSRDEWILVERADLDAVVAVNVDGFGFAAAPPRVLDLLRSAPPESLLDAAGLARKLPAGAHPIGCADLLFTDRVPPLRRLNVREAAPADVVAVRGRVSATDWEESGIEETERQWAAMDSAGSPAAIAGFKRWRSELAQMGVLADPGHRGAGYAYAAAAVATQETVRAGLIAQWRSRQGNDASRRLAQRLGFTHCGVQAAVALS
ncbi:GNAT family N-acetyltransferase [Zhihengliuella halotolerans]|uniref:GNAT family N-acetyltransferase n=1 Tax=Zhihengliuella halotolerans TaxID=370736 RepID=UPI0011AF8B04|nr:GNAT family N-acetyltransferase [Zhihengliuella halotolerans]